MDDKEFWRLARAYDDEFFQKILNEVVKRRTYTLHLAMPKSGSTWLTQILKKIWLAKGGAVSKLVSVYEDKPQEIEPRRFFNEESKDIFFVQQHLMYSAYSERLLRATETKVIFQYRNIADVMISLADMIEDQIFGSQNGIEGLSQPLVKNLSRDEIKDFILDVELPWYCKFYQGWMNSSLRRSDRFIEIKYEELVDAPAHTVSRLCDRLALDIDMDKLEVILNTVGDGFTRKNVGTVGRGEKEFAPRQLDKLKKVLRYYGMSLS